MKTVKYILLSKGTTFKNLTQGKNFGRKWASVVKDSYGTFKYVPREREITSDFFGAPRSSKQNTSINHAWLSSPCYRNVSMRTIIDTHTTRINFFNSTIKTINIDSALKRWTIILYIKNKQIDNRVIIINHTYFTQIIVNLLLILIRFSQHVAIILHFLTIISAFTFHTHYHFYC